MGLPVLWALLGLSIRLHPPGLLGLLGLSVLLVLLGLLDPLVQLIPFLLNPEDLLDLLVLLGPEGQPPS